MGNQSPREMSSTMKIALLLLSIVGLALVCADQHTEDQYTEDTDVVAVDDSDDEMDHGISSSVATASVAVATASAESFVCCKKSKWEKKNTCVKKRKGRCQTNQEKCNTCGGVWVNPEDPPSPPEDPPSPPEPCSSCDLVPCGRCQEGCPPSECEYKSEVDKSGSTSRNDCGKKKGIFNLGHVPLDCRRWGDPPEPCSSCDLVPCGRCQEGCPPSECEYQNEVDESGSTS